MHITNKIDDGTFNISAKFTTPIILSNIGDEYIYHIDMVSDLIKFTKFSDTIDGLNNTRNVDRFWRISYNECTWSDWLELPLFETNNIVDDKLRSGIFPLYNVSEDIAKKMFDYFPDLTSSVDYSVDIKWVRSGINIEGDLLLRDFLLEGVWDRNELSIPIATINPENSRSPIYIKPIDKFKVFKLTDVEIILSNTTPDRSAYIEYRISQNNWISSTNWEELTKSNISTAMQTHRLSPIRFFNIEYRVFRSGSDLTNIVKLHDINLIGDFQNVSEDYLKTNLMGIRECCQESNSTALAINEGDGIPGFIKNKNTPVNIKDSEESCLPPVFGAMDKQTLDKLWNPYDLNKAVDLYNSLSNSTNELFGWEVNYFLTDPDIKGTDHTFHEHTLKNIVDENVIKLSVDQNQFPDNQITFNQFDLSLFETFEVHITKDNFKKAFGVDRRPSKEDFMWFCDLNRMYQVEHSQPFRDFNNASVYYKVILKKYNKKSSIQPANETIANRIEELTSNTTLDELFGLEIQNDKTEVANKDQLATLTDDKTRYEFSASVVKELILNSSLVINKYHYDLSTVLPSDIAVKYSKIDNYMKDSDNRSYSAWFNIPSYVVNERHNFIQNHDGNIGYKIDLFNGEFNVVFNQDIYSMPVDILDNTWYCFVVNINNRQRKVEQFLYKRNVVNEVDASKLNTSKLLLVYSNVLDMNIGGFEFDNGNDIVITGSNMKLTNIRLYNNVIDQKTHTKILNQNILRDSDYLILADNSNKKMDLDRFDYN